jgi:hypothetical protein
MKSKISIPSGQSSAIIGWFVFYIGHYINWPPFLFFRDFSDWHRHSAIHHAETIAHRVGEPFGTLTCPGCDPN